MRMESDLIPHTLFMPLTIPSAYPREPYTHTHSLSLSLGPFPVWNLFNGSFTTRGETSPMDRNNSIYAGGLSGRWTQALPSQLCFFSPPWGAASSFQGAHETMLGFNSGILSTRSVPWPKWYDRGRRESSCRMGASALPAVMANDIPGQAMVPQSESVPAVHTQCPIPTLCYWFETDLRLGWWMVS